MVLSVSHPAMLIHPTRKLCRPTSVMDSSLFRGAALAQGWAYHRASPLLCAQGERVVVLAAGGGPDGSQLADAGTQADVADDAEYETVDKRDGATRGHDEADGAGEGDPGAAGVSRERDGVERHPEGEEWRGRTYLRIAKAIPTMVILEKRFWRWPSWAPE